MVLRRKTSRALSGLRRIRSLPLARKKGGVAEYLHQYERSRPAGPDTVQCPLSSGLGGGLSGFECWRCEPYLRPARLEWGMDVLPATCAGLLYCTPGGGLSSDSRQGQKQNLGDGQGWFTLQENVHILLSGAGACSTLTTDAFDLLADVLFRIG